MIEILPPPYSIYPTSFMFFETAHAASSAAIDPTATYAITDVIQVAIALTVLISWFLCVVFVLWGGVMLILSGGKDEKIKPAISSIRYAVVGLIVIILSLFVVPKIGDLMGLGISNYITPKVVFQRISELSQRIFGGNDASSINIDSGGSSSDLPDDFSDL